VALTALAGTALPAAAQTAAPTPDATPQDQVTTAGSTAPSASENQNLPGDIIVTATKRAENVQKVPISMTVVTGKTLSDFQAVDVKSIQNSVPNVFVEQTAGNDVIYIRGFGSPPSNFSFDQSVSMYMDGIYAGKLRQEQAPFFDVGRVEVLRGPQGALFGKNTAAGAISIVSAGPTDKMEAAITGTYNFDQKGYDLNGYVSGPVSDTFGVRVAFRLQDQDGWITNLFNGNKEPRNKMQMVRATFRWAPSAGFDDTLKVEYENVNRIGGISVSSTLTGPQDPQLVRYADVNPLGQEGVTNKSVLLSNTANIQLGDFTLTSVTGYSWYNGSVVNNFDQRTPTGAIVFNSVYNSYPEWLSQYSQEIRLLSPKGKTLEFIVGAYYDNARYHLDQLGGFNIAAINYFGLLHTIFNQWSNTKSVFGQATLNASSRFRVIGSLRYSDTYKRGDFRGRLEYGPFAIRPVNTVAHQSFSEGNLDPSATAQFDIAKDVMLYATYGRGSKSGGFVSNTYGTDNTTFRYKPERSTNYEAGIKFAFLDHAVVGSLSVYDTQFKNLQVSVYNPANSTYVTGNAASATSKGVETTLTIRPVANFDITASGAYMDIKYDDYPGAACLATQTVAQCDPNNPASFKNNNLAGYSPPYTSKWNGSVQAHAWFMLTDDVKFDITGVAAGRSGFFDSDNQSPIFGYQKGFIKYDLRLQVAGKNDAWHVALVGKNLSNEITTGSAFNLPAPITSVPRAMLYIDPPRSFALEVGFKY
jgi:iron complex outermembrane receptor protein